MNSYLSRNCNLENKIIPVIEFIMAQAAQAYFTKTLFKRLSQHLPKEALSGIKEVWTPDILTQAIEIIKNGYKFFSTIRRHLMRLKAFIDSLEEVDQVDGAQGTMIDQRVLIDELILNDVLNDAHRALKNKNKNNTKSLDI